MMKEGLYYGDEMFDQEQIFDGIPIGMYLGYAANSIKIELGIDSDIMVGIAVFRITGEAINIIFILPRYEGDCGDETVAGWTVFAEFGRKDFKDDTHGSELASIIHDSGIRVIRAHNIAIRTLINDFYGKYVIKDGDMLHVRNHLMIMWRRIIGMKPITSDKNSRYVFYDDIREACRIKGVEDYLIAAYELLCVSSVDEQIVALREALKYTSIRFIFYMHDKKTKNGTVIYRVNTETEYQVAVVRIVEGSPIACMFMTYSNVDNFRHLFWWITTADEEYGMIENALHREFELQMA